MKGQVSIEIIIGAVMLLLAFVFIAMYSFEKNSNIEVLEEILENKSECREIADVISSVYASGKKTSIEFYSEKDFTVGQGWVDVEGFSCNYYGIAQESFIVKGNIRIKDLNGVVVVENY
ncbi:MAG: hypothetical protein COT90_03740 [Candidatus Diapherotrites archaeon CG10_big_fil_rev_8_21_14_0_10_31_34]|nr:MAG: hypothetical protein COT90_03740 [Candidatus Diapherotrites archaeon CG10_big_fil_rev_8_21_14_0_10_31_34]PJA19743.1 MAG: hypothetical protein COX63_01315 [Candidatus Diapherotrites archaeon CG_4_10_14_0_2_um_filter_31_5]